MSERAAMKRRVRGLLHKNWLSPLLALVIAWVPVCLIYAIAIWLLRPTGAVGASVQITWSFSDPMSMLLQLLALFSDPSALIQPLLGWLPLVIVLLCAHLFLAMPMAVFVAQYFLAFLRGKKPDVLAAYREFWKRYPRALGGSAYTLLWQTFWFLASFVIPTVLMFICVPVVSAVGIDLKYQVYVFIGVMILCVVWYIAFFFLFINRMLAYSLAHVSIAAQPRLAAYRAVRLSRKLMRGNKWRLAGLCLSFLVYLIPTIAGIVGIMLGIPLVTRIGASEGVAQAVYTVSCALIVVNQAVWVYLGPYMSACLHAFYIERKREALIDQEVTRDDFHTPGRERDALGRPDPDDLDDGPESE